MIVEYPEEILINEKKYVLYGVVLHAGTLDNGHYTSLAKRD
jgi:ubiquitin C-terminal hydrolase